METDRNSFQQSGQGLKKNNPPARRKPVATIGKGLWRAMLLLMVLMTTAWAQGPAPDFTLPDLAGRPVSLSQFRGTFVVLDFWATWCVPCRKSLPVLAEAAKKYHDRNVVVLGLAVDDPDSFDNSYLANFVKKYNVDYPILRADDGVVVQYLGDDDPTIPTLFVIDPQGQILEKHEGVISEELDLMLQRLLGDR